MNANDFAGKSALVTGAGRGIGRATAIGLAAAGAHVGLLARSSDELSEVAATIAQQGGDASVVRADLSDAAETEAAITETLRGLPSIDILINNAAVVWPLGPTLAADPADLRKAIEVNLFAVITLTRAFLPGMLERGWGRIVNVSSGIVASPTAMIGANGYVLTKSALEAHTVNLAAELAESGVTVNAYRPGSVDTAMQGYIREQPPEAIGQALHDRFVETYAAGTLISPETSAASLLEHLASVETGRIWRVAGA
jgi:NAD(P)-dependent dehydrogenase (short-subunit alcohol dehydrogenase family)